jgi:ubiquinone/menaquinone biosynthesis C-methylase UbiE
MKDIFKLCIFIITIIIIYIYVNNNINNYKNNIENFMNENFMNEENDIYDKEFVELYEIIYRDYTDIDYDYNIINNKILSKLTNNDIKIAIAGSGVGKMCKKFKEKYDNVVGIDNSENMILYSKRTYPNIKFIKSNLLNQNSLNKNEYGLIVLDERTLFYNKIKSQEYLIQNCFNWLMPGGFLVVPIYDPEELQVASRYYSSNYIDDKGNTHGFTYLNDFTHNCYYIKDGKDNNTYNFYDKIVLKDGSKRIKKTKLYIQPKEKTYDLILKNGFEQIYIEPVHLQILGGYELAIFRKKKEIISSVDEIQSKK